jgi:LL-diaminopimelate aminotransferase
VIRVNEHFSALQPSYLFSDISKRVAAFQAAHPEREIIRLGIGDVTQPLPAACVKAFRAAVDEMGRAETFRGYPPYEGLDFLREKIAEHDFGARGIRIGADEIFISDGAKSDTANIQELFAPNIRVAVPDPVYPVYVDSQVMAGRGGAPQDGRYAELVYLESTKENGFVPAPPNESVDLIYLCFPNNPTGAVATKAELRAWVHYAHERKALILFDAAYEAFIRDPELPRSIYEIPGATEVAIECRSFSKTAGFTGTRCAYAVIPHTCMAYNSSGSQEALNPLWYRRQSTKFNGVSYPVQRAAEAVYTPEGQSQVRRINDYYLRNAELIRREMTALGFSVSGGEHSPYLWVDVKMDSWSFFDLLLTRAGVVCTPGSGFGRCGQGFVRISSFNDFENTERAMQRVRQALEKK